MTRRIGEPKLIDDVRKEMLWWWLKEALRQTKARSGGDHIQFGGDKSGGVRLNYAVVGGSEDPFLLIPESFFVNFCFIFVSFLFHFLVIELLFEFMLWCCCWFLFDVKVSDEFSMKKTRKSTCCRSLKSSRFMSLIPASVMLHYCNGWTLKNE